MIRLAVCDDEAQSLESAKHMVARWSADRGIPVQILCFNDGDALIEDIRSHRTDIILLDIMMPLLHGMDAAREIRDIDQTVKIIFLTASPEFALESYSVKASGYIVKPIPYDQLSQALDDAANDLREEPKSIVLKTAGGYHKIYYRDIEYIEAQNKRVAFSLRSGQSLMVPEPLYSFEDRLSVQDGFFKCHRSYIVSLSSVRSLSAGEIILESGRRIPIARGAGKAFQDAYFSYMFGQ